jgi:tetratricopeptide (TPR) repeat protein
MRRNIFAGIPSVVLATFSFLGPFGCNTDPVWEPNQSLDAPTTRIDRPQGVIVPDIQVAQAGEADLVEQVLANRALYHRSLTALHNFYRDRGYETKRIWAERELRDANRIQPFRYMLSGEIPAEQLVPRDSIVEADELYDEAMALMQEGGHSIPLLYRERKMRAALQKFRQLIERYPTCDKIDDAAFYSGEIYKEYFKGYDKVAVRWYERAFAWNPDVSHPARFQAAKVYDLRLHDRDRALELYRAVLELEDDRGRVSFAVRRIEQLAEIVEPKTTIVDESAAFAAPDDH